RMRPADPVHAVAWPRRSASRLGTVGCAMTLRANAPSRPNAVVDLYLARGRLRAEIPMQGFDRISDLFNNASGEFMGAFTHMTSIAEHGSVVRRDLVVRLRDVRLVRPIDERTTPVVLSALHERVHARVVLD